MEFSPVPIETTVEKKPVQVGVSPEKSKIKFKIVNLLKSTDESKISTKAIVNMKIRANEGRMRVGESDESNAVRELSPNAVSLVQKPAEKTPTELQPPPTKLQPPPTELPPTPLPAAPPKPQEKGKPPAELPLGGPIGLAALHSQIGIKDEKTGIEVKPTVEIAEEYKRLGAWKRQTEEEPEYKGKLAFFRRFRHRLWRHTIHMTSSYGKESGLELKERGLMGLQVIASDYDFRRKMMAFAKMRVEQRSKQRKIERGWREGIGWGEHRLKWYDSNWWRDFFIAENEGDKEYFKIVEELVNAAYSPDSQEARNLRKELKEFETVEKARIAEDTKHGKQRITDKKPFDTDELLTDFRSILKNDYFEAARTAQQLVDSDLMPDLIQAAAGEVKGVKKLKLNAEAQAYLINNVIRPLLENGARKGDGSVDDVVLLRAIKAANDFQSSKEFGTWLKSQLESPDEEVRNSAKALDASLSYGNTVVDWTIKELLQPAVEIQKKHADSMLDIDQWIEALSKKPLEVALGTLRAGPAEIMKEGIMQRLGGREIRRDKVEAIFKEVIDGKGAKPYPQRFEDAAVNRASMLTRAANIGKGPIALGFAGGLATYVGLSIAKVPINFMAPIIGGSAVAGVVKGLQERSFFTREWEQHNIEDELGYKVTEELVKDAKRRAGMERLKRHKRWMQEITDPMTERLNKLEEFIKTDKEVEKIDDLLKELIGLVADTEARFQIMYERGIGLLSSSNPYSYQTEKTNLNITKCKAVMALEKYFQTDAGKSKLKKLSTEVGMAEGTVFRNPSVGDGLLDKLVKEQRTIIETGVGTTLEFQKALGDVKIEEEEAIKARENAFYEARRGRMFGQGVMTFLSGVSLGWASHEASVNVANWLGWGKSVHETFDPSALQEIQGIKMRFPPGLRVAGDRIIDSSNNKTILDLTGKRLSESGGDLSIKDISTGERSSFKDVIKSTGLVDEGRGGDLASASFTSGGGVEKEIIGGVETKVPVGTHWQDIGGGRFNLVPDDPNNKIILLQNVKYENGQFVFDGDDPVNLRFLQNNGSFNYPPETSSPDLSVKVEDPTWPSKLSGLKNKGDFLDDPFGHYRFILEQDKGVTKVLKIFELNDLLGGGKSVGAEVAHNFVEIDTVKNTISYEAVQGNAIPEKIVKALEEMGLVKRDELYKAIRLDAADQVARVPANLSQIYADNKVVDFTDVEVGGNVHWLSHGGWAKPTGAIYDFASGENTYLSPMPDWQPFPMTEIVEGKPVFSLAHFFNWYEEAKVIDEGHVQILSGPNAGKTMEINSQMGLRSEGVDWLRKAAAAGKRVVFDSNPKNRIVMEAPEGFINDLRAIKEGHGDLSRFFAEVRFDPLSNKGVVAQFKGDSIWNAFADPSQAAKSFGDNAFIDASGNVRGWTHFMWTEKAGDFAKVYSFANIGPTEHFHNLLLHNPFGPGVQKIPGIPEITLDKIETTIPTFNFDFDRVTPGGDFALPIPFFLWPRRPLEAHVAVQSATIPTAVSGRGPYTGAYATVGWVGKGKPTTAPTKAKGEEKPTEESPAEEKPAEERKPEGRQPLIEPKRELTNEQRVELVKEQEKLKKQLEELSGAAKGIAEKRIDQIRQELQWDTFLIASARDKQFIQVTPPDGLAIMFREIGIDKAKAQKLKEDEDERNKFLPELFAHNMAQRYVIDGLSKDDRQAIADKTFRGMTKEDIQLLRDFEPIGDIYDRARAEGRSLDRLTPEEKQFIAQVKAELGMDKMSDDEFRSLKIKYIGLRAVYDSHRRDAVKEILARPEMQQKINAWRAKIRAEIGARFAKQVAPPTTGAPSTTAPPSETKKKEEREKTSTQREITDRERQDLTKLKGEVENVSQDLRKPKPDKRREMAEVLNMTEIEFMGVLTKTGGDPNKLQELAERIVFIRRVDSGITEEELEREERQINPFTDQVFESDMQDKKYAQVKRFYKNELAQNLFKDYRKSREGKVKDPDEYIKSFENVIAEFNRQCEAKDRFSPEEVQQIIQYAIKIQRLMRAEQLKLRAEKVRQLRDNYHRLLPQIEAK